MQVVSCVCVQRTGAGQCVRLFMSLFVCLWAYIPTSLHLFLFMRSHLCMHVCSLDNVYLSCPQVCAAAASLCVRLMVISIARGSLMAHTCVSHYRKLRILLSKSRMFHSHFVISTKEEAARHPAESLKPSWQIFGAAAQEILMRAQRHGCNFWKGNQVLFIVSGINISNNWNFLSVGFSVFSQRLN